MAFRLSPANSATAESLAAWPNAGMFASGHVTGPIRIYKLFSGRGAFVPLVECVGHTAGVKLLAPLQADGPNRVSLVSAGADRRLRLWDISTAAPPPATRPSPSSAAASPWLKPSSFPAPTAPQASFVAELGGHASAVATVLIGYGDGHVVAAVERGIHFWAHRHRAFQQAPSTSGGGGPGKGGAERRTLGPVLSLGTASSQAALAVAAPAAASTLAAGGTDGLVRLWDVRSGSKEPERAIEAHSSRVHVLQWLPDNKRLVTGAAAPGEALKFWDVKSGVCSGAYTLPSPLLCSELLADGRLVTGHADGRLLIWDPRRGGSKLAGWHAAAVTHMCLMSDGRLVTGCSGGPGMGRVWNLAGSEALCATLQVSNKEMGVVAMVPAPDRCVLLSTIAPHGDAAVSVWVTPDDLSEPAPLSSSSSSNASAVETPRASAGGSPGPKVPAGASPTQAPSDGDSHALSSSISSSSGSVSAVADASPPNAESQLPEADPIPAPSPALAAADAWMEACLDDDGGAVAEAEAAADPPASRFFTAANSGAPPVDCLPVSTAVEVVARPAVAAAVAATVLIQAAEERLAACALRLGELQGEVAACVEYVADALAALSEARTAAAVAAAAAEPRLQVEACGRDPVETGDLGVETGDLS